MQAEGLDVLHNRQLDIKPFLLEEPLVVRDVERPVADPGGMGDDQLFDRLCRGDGCGNGERRHGCDRDRPDMLKNRFYLFCSGMVMLWFDVVVGLWRPSAFRPRRSCENAEQFEHDRHADPGRATRGGERRRHLDEIRADDVQPVEQSNHLLCLAGGEAADLGRSRTRSESRIYAVDIESDIGRLLSDDLARFCHYVGDAAFVEFLDADDPHTLRQALADIFVVIHRAANADLDDAFGVEIAVLDRPVERGTVRVLEPAEIAVEEIRVGIEMDHADRRIGRDRLEDRILRRDDRHPHSAA